MSRRRDFPCLEQLDDQGRPMCYLDSGATAQRPRAVVLAEEEYYLQFNANVHRSAYPWSARATAAVEGARAKVAALVHAAPGSIVWTGGTTDALNKLALMLSGTLEAGDRVVTTVMEHHSNLLPWQRLAARGVEVAYADVHDDGTLDIDDFAAKVTDRTKVVAFTHQSNVLGTINPAEELVAIAHEAGALAVVDAAQSVPHMPVDVQAMDCDFLAASGHKMLGPTGVGFFYGKPEHLARLQPAFLGGGIVEQVTLEGPPVLRPPPHRFEAGTPPVAQVIGLGEAAQYLLDLGMDRIRAHERALVEHALKEFRALPGVQVAGPPDPAHRGGVLAFTVRGVPPEDVNEVLKAEGIMVRFGLHCAEPLARRLGIGPTTRATFHVYNDLEDVDRLVGAVRRASALEVAA